MGYHRTKRKSILDHGCNRALDARVLRMKSPKWSELRELGLEQASFSNADLLRSPSMAGEQDGTTRIQSIHEIKVIHRAKWKGVYGGYVDRLKRVDPMLTGRSHHCVTEHLPLERTASVKSMEVLINDLKGVETHAKDGEKAHMDDKNIQVARHTVPTHDTTATTPAAPSTSSLTCVSVLHRVESRLDVARHRSGLVTSRYMARQRITHRHVRVTPAAPLNQDRMVDSAFQPFICRYPSYRLKPGMVVEIKRSAWDRILPSVLKYWTYEPELVTPVSTTVANVKTATTTTTATVTSAPQTVTVSSSVPADSAKNAMNSDSVTDSMKSLVSDSTTDLTKSSGSTRPTETDTPAHRPTRVIPSYLHVDLETGCFVFLHVPLDSEVMLPFNFDATLMSRLK